MGNWGGSNFGVCGYQNLGTPKHSLKIIEESIHINHLPPDFPHPGHVRFGPLVTPSENAWRGALIEIDCFNLSAAHTQLGIGPMKALELRTTVHLRCVTKRKVWANQWKDHEEPWTPSLVFTSGKGTVSDTVSSVRTMVFGSDLRRDILGRT
jgi:hypothetical protein